jgi:hypothetical protein
MTATQTLQMLGLISPKQAGIVTAGTIFHGETTDDITGDYLSQFLIKDVPYGDLA